MLDTQVVMTLASGPHATQLVFSPSIGNYVGFWADPTTGRITAGEISADGALIATGVLPGTILGSPFGMSVAHNPISGTMLLVGFSKMTSSAEQLRGIELNQHGAPESAVIEITSAALNGNLTAPRVTARPISAEWLVNTESASMVHYAQIVGTTSANGGSSLRLDGCYLPDPFAALGGGVCSNGGWVPPTIVTPPPSTPPPSAPSSGCATPDPFASLGGGTCQNGGWLPPGAAAPPSTPSTPPPSTPPPSPPSSGTCTTADPFAGLGGGVCHNGGWLPPGMAPSGGSSGPTPPPSTPPPSTPPPSTPTACTTADPFASMGGGVCANGGWLPPGMSAPSGATPSTPTPPPLTPPPSSGGCTTPDPFAAMGGGTCYAGGWLPPGMPIPGGGGD